MTTQSAARRPSANEIESWLVQRLREMHPFAECIDARLSFERNGVDSISGVRISVELSDWLGEKLEPTLVWDYPSIRDLARALGREGGCGEP
jgi:acyl carrier protein